MHKFGDNVHHVALSIVYHFLLPFGVSELWKCGYIIFICLLIQEKSISFSWGSYFKIITFCHYLSRRQNQKHGKALILHILIHKQSLCLWNTTLSLKNYSHSVHFYLFNIDLVLTPYGTINKMTILLYHHLNIINLTPIDNKSVGIKW